MNEHSRQALETSYKDAASWNQDRLRAVSTSRRIAWYVAAGAATIAVLEAFALAALAPIKTVVPYTLMVDRTTGYVQALKPGEMPQISPDSALTQSFLAQYVTAREGFDANTVNTSYRKVALWSAANARSSYLSQMQATNPESPFKTYAPGTVVQAEVKSVSPVGADQAFVRFDTVRTDPNGTSQRVGSWVSVIKFRYSGEPMKLEDRFVNPLGFQVVSYHRDAEAVPAAIPATAADSATPAGANPLSTMQPPIGSSTAPAPAYYRDAPVR
jgi:type IV secretion system protein VirB8